MPSFVCVIVTTRRVVRRCGVSVLSVCCSRLLKLDFLACRITRALVGMEAGGYHSPDDILAFRNTRRFVWLKRARRTKCCREGGRGVCLIPRLRKMSKSYVHVCGVDDTDTAVSYDMFVVIFPPHHCTRYYSGSSSGSTHATVSFCMMTRMVLGCLVRAIRCLIGFVPSISLCCTCSQKIPGKVFLCMISAQYEFPKYFQSLRRHTLPSSIVISTGQRLVSGRLPWGRHCNPFLKSNKLSLIKLAFTRYALSCGAAWHGVSHIHAQW